MLNFMHELDTPSIEAIRVALVRAGIPAYVVCAKIRLHPVNLSKILNGRAPLKPELGRRILAAIEVIRAQAD